MQANFMGINGFRMISADKMTEWILASSVKPRSGDGMKALLESAQRAWPRVLTYAYGELPAHLRAEEKSSIAFELWEKILKSVAGTMERRGTRQIIDLDAYLIGIFKHRLHRRLTSERRRLTVLAFVSPDELAEKEKIQVSHVPAPAERALLIKEIIACMDGWLKEVWTARTYGYSWSEIGKDMGLTEQQAKMRFRYALSKLKERLLGCSKR